MLPKLWKRFSGGFSRTERVSDDVGRLLAIVPDKAFHASEQIEHLVGIVFVYLAPEGVDEDFLGYGEPPVAAVGGAASMADRL